MIVFENTKAAEGLGIFFKNLGRSSKAGKNLATNMFKNPSRALQIGVKIGTAAVSKFPKAALCTIPGVINFYHTGKWLYLGKLVKDKNINTNFIDI